MLETNGNRLCDLCFSPLSPASQTCCACSGKPNHMVHPTVLKEGTILNGRYSVGKVLGKGGFGVTYLCYDLSENGVVAIKEYFPGTLSYRHPGTSSVTFYEKDKAESFREGAEKFLSEAKLLSQFNDNPYVISVYRFFYENNTAYFVMEYLDGVDLKEYIRQHGGKISEPETIRIISQTLKALNALHSKGVLHRDISPDNIFVCKSGSVKLIDFGAARQVVSQASNSLSVILKQGFAPIEQYQKKGNQGPWTDLYALGATIYYCITGRIIDDAMSRMENSRLDMTGVSPALKNILNKMLAVNIKDRYHSVQELEIYFSTLDNHVNMQYSPTPGNHIPTPSLVKNNKKINSGGNNKKSSSKKRNTQKNDTKKYTILLIVTVALMLSAIIGGIIYSVSDSSPSSGSRANPDEKLIPDNPNENIDISKYY